MTNSETTETTTQRTLRRAFFVALAICLPTYEVVEHFSDGGRARAAGIATGILVLVVGGRWELRRHVWFWLSAVALLVIHAVLVVKIPWTDRVMPAPELWPIGLADFAFIYGVIALAEMAFDRSEDRAGGAE